MIYATTGRGLKQTVKGSGAKKGGRGIKAGNSYRYIYHTQARQRAVPLR
jgi:hypothetical protein